MPTPPHRVLQAWFHNDDVEAEEPVWPAAGFGTDVAHEYKYEYHCQYHYVYIYVYEYDDSPFATSSMALPPPPLPPPPPPGLPSAAHLPTAGYGRLHRLLRAARRARLPRLPVEAWQAIARATLVAEGREVAAWRRLSGVCTTWRDGLLGARGARPVPRARPCA